MLVFGWSLDFLLNEETNPRHMNCFFPHFWPTNHHFPPFNILQSPAGPGHWQAWWVPGGAGLLRWTEGALRDFSGAHPQMARTPSERREQLS